MTEEKKASKKQFSADGLPFHEAKDMTIEEAVKKESELKAGISDSDNVLDKYIKQHKEDISSQKFEATSKDFEALDTASLDDFIKKQREELSKEDSATSVVLPADEEEMSITEIDETDSLDDVVVSDTIAASSALKEEEAADDEAYALSMLDDEKQPWYKKKGVIISLIIFLLLSILSLAFWVNQKNSSTGTSSSTSSTTSTSSSKSESELLSEFNTAYNKFFVDSDQTQLKNSEFGNLSNLEKILEQLSSSSKYNEYKQKYDALSQQIAAIQAVNAKFNSDVIVNGQQVSSTLKDGSNLEDLSSQTLSTGNTTLDTLINSVVSTYTAVVSTSTDVAGGTTTYDNSYSTGTVTIADAGTTSSANTSTAVSNLIVGNNGLSTATNLQRSLSRVPYNQSAIDDTTNPSWTFNEGVLEKIIEISHARGYFSGNDYIIEPVNIINGNGYYNMFKTDGTYLFSINCKTGYFVGNGSGYSDNLDY